MLHCENNYYRNNVMIRFGKGDMPSTIKFIEKNWQLHIPESVFYIQFPG